MFINRNIFICVADLIMIYKKSNWIRKNKNWNKSFKNTLKILIVPSFYSYFILLTKSGVLYYYTLTLKIQDFLCLLYQPQRATKVTFICSTANNLWWIIWVCRNAVLGQSTKNW